MITPDELATERISAFAPTVCLAVFQACLGIGSCAARGCNCGTGEADSQCSFTGDGKAPRASLSELSSRPQPSHLVKSTGESITVTTIGQHLQQLVSIFAPSGMLVMGIDDTIERRWGKRIAALLNVNYIGILI